LIIWVEDDNSRSNKILQCSAHSLTGTALKFPGFCDLVSGFLRLVTVWLHVGRGGVTGSDGP